MAKKKSNNKKSKTAPDKSRNLFLSVMALLFIGGGVWISMSPSESTPVAPATGKLIETRPVLSPALFTGKVARAYQIANEIPKIIDSQFCYCYCKKNDGHKTLLTCFTNRHGSKCDICINEVLYAYELYKQGKTLDEIVELVDKKFYRPYQPHKI
ncbi:MAG: hypothetical protein G3M78_13140 [Candidatus Nitrohelix vancouverensis]|uniref:Uncharacterized protein n=1 Tax=Candidatus Nitrohelix vancouverensis TaxID=2705534 RepID=A0A7T0C479_9BACT|nr:MAG: hypothetical protein G3M78_13140 [Candidatus Nitrohelix vancouverensis]